MQYHHPLLDKTNTVRKRGLEPPQVTLLVPKTSASTIPPLAHTIYLAMWASIADFYKMGNCLDGHETLSIIEHYRADSTKCSRPRLDRFYV